MTAKQTALYFREWGKVHKRFPDIDRHDLHIRALGSDKSSKAFTNSDLDKILAAFKALTEPASLDAQLRQAKQDRVRLLWKLQHYQAPLLALYLEHPSPLTGAEAYIEAVAKDKFHRSISELTASQLEQLRNTIAARLNTLRKEAGHTIHQMHQLAGLKCPCSQCQDMRRPHFPQPH